MMLLSVTSFKAGFKDINSNKCKVLDKMLGINLSLNPGPYVSFQWFRAVGPVASWIKPVWPSNPK